MKAVVGLQPEAWLMLFGMSLIITGVLEALPIPKHRIVIDKTYKTIAITLGIVSLVFGTWMYFNAKFNLVLDASPHGSLTPPALRALNLTMPEYATLQNHKAIAVSDAGYVGVSGLAPTIEYAKLKAWAFCIGYTKGPDHCGVVMVDDQKIGTW